MADIFYTMEHMISAVQLASSIIGYEKRDYVQQRRYELHKNLTEYLDRLMV